MIFDKVPKDTDFFHKGEEKGKKQQGSGRGGGEEIHEVMEACNWQKAVSG